MSVIIGKLIKEIAEGKGYTQEHFGKQINRTKQGVASIYRRSTIDISLLQTICAVLDYDFFAHLYKTEPLKSFKQKEVEEWEKRIDSMTKDASLNQDLLNQRQELVDTQRKLIQELEEKVKNLSI